MLFYVLRILCFESSSPQFFKKTKYISAFPPCFDASWENENLTVNFRTVSDVNGGLRGHVLC